MRTRYPADLLDECHCVAPEHIHPWPEVNEDLRTASQRCAQCSRQASDCFSPCDVVDEPLDLKRPVRLPRRERDRDKAPR